MLTTTVSPMTIRNLKTHQRIRVAQNQVFQSTDNRSNALVLTVTQSVPDHVVDGESNTKMITPGSIQNSHHVSHAQRLIHPISVVFSGTFQSFDESAIVKKFDARSWTWTKSKTSDWSIDSDTDKLIIETRSGSCIPYLAQFMDIHALIPTADMFWYIIFGYSTF